MEVIVSKYLRLDRLKADGKAPIHFRVCWTGQKIRFSSGDAVDPAHWDPDEERVKKTAGNAGKAVNRLLDILQSGIETWFENRATIPTVQEVQNELERIRVTMLGYVVKPVSSPVSTPKPLTIAEYRDQYIELRKNERSLSWCKSMQYVVDHLLAFRPALQWDELRINTFNQFKTYLQEEEEHSDNTINTYIGLLRGMFEYAEEKNNIALPKDYRWIEVGSTETIRPILAKADETKILNATLEPTEDEFHSIGTEPLEVTRWFFLMSCYTGLRRVDQWQLINPNLATIENVHCLMALQQKTGKRVPIPLTDDAYHLLKNPVASKKPPITQWFNFLLKEVGKQSRLEQPVTVGSFYKGALLADSLPFYRTMSSHMGRRTFATRMTEGGLNLFVLQEIMGHETIASTRKYATLSNNTIVEQALSAWNKAKG